MSKTRVQGMRLLKGGCIDFVSLEFITWVITSYYEMLFSILEDNKNYLTETSLFVLIIGYLDYFPKVVTSHEGFGSSILKLWVMLG